MAPHDPREVPSEYLHLYADNDITLPANFMPEHRVDNGGLGVQDELLASHLRTREELRTNRREFVTTLRTVGCLRAVR